jgi:hypothetical protein
MRGGTSKGVFLRPENLPSDAAARDRILLRIIGSPDPYGKQIDGMGAATSSTSKIVLIFEIAAAGLRRGLPLRPPVRHADRGRRGAQRERAMGGQEGADEPQRASAHGGLGEGAKCISV